MYSGGLNCFELRRVLPRMFKFCLSGSTLTAISGSEFSDCISLFGYPFNLSIQFSWLDGFIRSSDRFFFSFVLVASADRH